MVLGHVGSGEIFDRHISPESLYLGFPLKSLSLSAACWKG